MQIILNTAKLLAFIILLALFLGLAVLLISYLNVSFSVNDAITALTLIIAVITFYSQFLRVSKELYFVKINKFDTNFMPVFAFLNTGNKDILISNIECFFRLAEMNGRSFPTQKIEWEENEGFILPANKSILCRVNMHLESGLFSAGEKTTENGKNISSLPLGVRFQWVDSNGKQHSEEIIFYEYLFSENGKIFSRRPLLDKKKISY